jgi:carboxyl-terminal processing protease
VFPNSVRLVANAIAAVILVQALAPTCSYAATDEPVTAEFAKTTFDKVDSLVRKHFYDPNSTATWQSSVDAHKSAILGARTLTALDKSINEALHGLHASHTQFVTPNDETYYFLESLFAEHDAKHHSNPPKMDYVGAITGGVNCGPREVRYVLDGSPAEAAGIKIGDEIVSVDGAPYIGQLTFKGTSGKSVSVKLRRAGTDLTVAVKPVLRDEYEAYIEAIGKSTKIKSFPEGKIGYVHVWCGGSGKSHEAIEQALDKLEHTDALIFDLRDGYGGNFYDDLDYFMRNPAGYPSFTSIARNGKKWTSFMAYSKPVVCLINGGSRSGKELLAYAFKKTGRATLVGETTAGAVLAGRLFEVNDRSALYLAVAGVTVEGAPLEAKGVAPDVEVKVNCADRGTEDKQYEEAVRLLREKLRS